MAATTTPDDVLELDIDSESDPEFKADPLGRWAELAGMARVIRSAVRPWTVWYVLAYDDIVAVLEDPATFSSYAGSGLTELRPEPLIPQELDPPEHTSFRAPLNPAFTPRSVRGIAEMVHAEAVEAIEAVADAGGCEFVQAIGRRFPTTVFMRIMGLPVDDADDLLRWMGELMHADPAISAEREAKEAARHHIFGYLAQLIAARRAEPADDLLSELVTADVGGRTMTDRELLNTAMLLYMAGLDTVAGALAYVVERMADDPDHRAHIRTAALAGEDRLREEVEELFRRTAIVSMGRRVTRDVTFAGCEMKAGDRVIVPMAAANADTDMFPTPLDHVSGRRPNRHLAFGHGPHRCLGSHLARLELSVFLQEWFARIPDWAVVPGSRRDSTAGAVASLHQLHLRW